MDTTDDFDIKDLISELQANSEKAYTQLYNKYSALLYSFVFKLTKSDTSHR